MNVLPSMPSRSPSMKFRKMLAAGGVAIVSALACSAHGEPPPDGTNLHCGGQPAPFGEHGPGAPMHGGMPPMGGMPPPPGAMHEDGAIGPIPPFLFGLQFSEAQQDKIFAINHAAAPLLREQGKLARKNADRIREITLSADYDEAKLKALAEAEAHASAEIAVLHARTTHQIYALLSPEQRAQADAMKANFEAHHDIRAQIEELKPKFEHPAGPDVK